MDVLAVAHAVAVAKPAGQDIGDDLHVAVAVGIKTRAGLHDVFVDDAQRAEAHMRGVVVVGEGETVPAFQPAVMCVAACVCLA